ncbi:CAP domain-containing protein [Pseudogracilibacillus auburnensis]|uniref:Uncharacterized protein YkwD n=1 Tax=Pseudogracilibacillus auburnensis TaxID=1494959 RepID=A0A2V3W4K3_9BACI|nr:CAP-associated domain-containing protein [Pseudogracilibacillus auburnensis]PXW89227.1 uncharacterized protein YkwD [Pseudogracilibacillus auburnensis]
MRKIGIILFIVILIGTGVYFVEKEYVSKSIDMLVTTDQSELPKLKSNQATKEMKELLQGDLFTLMEKTSSEVKDELGEPIRKDLTPYGYTWWIYTDESTFQIQVGIEDDSVQTIYATGEDISIEPFKIGASFDSVKGNFPFQDKVTYQSGLAFYSFLLNETDINTNPLIKLSDNVFVQCYFDTFTEQLSSIRIITGDILLKQRMYEMEYRGTLPEEVLLSDEDWKQIEKGMEQQIFDLTNIYRHRFDVAPLIKDEQVSEVAFLHSQDMFDQKYFSHYSLDGNGLKERLEEKEIYYLSAGENIAAQHTDAPAAMEGWLNSEGHREALLHEDYTHLGIGVHRLYYTQNFLLKP